MKTSGAVRVARRLHARNNKATIPRPTLGRRLRKKTRDSLVRCAQDKAACEATPATSCKRTDARHKTGDSLLRRPLYKEALVSTPITSGQRAKVRSSRYGVRLWIDPTLKTAFEAASLALRDSKNQWTPKSWKLAVRMLAKEKFGLVSHGGLRHHSNDETGSLFSDDLGEPVAAEKRDAIPSLGDPENIGAIRDASNQPSGSNEPPATGLNCFPLLHSTGSFIAEYDASETIPVMWPIGLPVPSNQRIPFTPQPVVDWLYQVLAIALEMIQGKLGTRAWFRESGLYAGDDNLATHGGQLAAFWGTELGARREQSLVAWDYDIDLAAFITPGLDFDCIWCEVKEFLEPLGLHLICHTPGFKYRIAPQHPLAFDDWKERYHLARLENPGKARGVLNKIASESRKKNEPLQSPTGTNCLDLEVYSILPGHTITIQGSSKIPVSCEHVFPLVEGIFGPLRIPLPASPRILDAEYGSQWRHVRVAKVIGSNGKSHSVTVETQQIRRCAWPSKPIIGCDSLLGCYHGAGVDPSPADLVWRFASNFSPPMESSVTQGLPEE